MPQNTTDKQIRHNPINWPQSITMCLFKQCSCALCYLLCVCCANIFSINASSKCCRIDATTDLNILCVHCWMEGEQKKQIKQIPFDGGGMCYVQKVLCRRREFQEWKQQFHTGMPYEQCAITVYTSVHRYKPTAPCHKQNKHLPNESTPAIAISPLHEWKGTFFHFFLSSYTFSSRLWNWLLGSRPNRVMRCGHTHGTRRLKCHCNITFYCVAEKGKDTTAAATESFCLCTSLVS